MCLLHPLIYLGDFGESYIIKLLLNLYFILAVDFYTNVSDALYIQCSIDGKLGSHPYQRIISSQFPVEDSNSVLVYDDVDKPKVVMRKDKCRAVHSKLFAMFLEGFCPIVAPFPERVYPIAVDSS